MMDDALVIANLGLARNIARKEARRFGRAVDPDEFLSWAYEGLVGAARTYDASTGVPFVPHAMNRIYGSIKDGRRANDALSRSHRRQVNEGTRPDFERPASLDAEVGVSGESWADVLAGRRDEDYATVEIIDSMTGFLDALREMKPAYHEAHRLTVAGLTRSEVGVALGVTEARVSQVVRQVGSWAREAIHQGTDPRVLLSRAEYGKTTPRRGRQNLVGQITDVLAHLGGEMVDDRNQATILQRLVKLTDAEGAPAIRNALVIGEGRGIFVVDRPGGPRRMSRVALAVAV